MEGCKSYTILDFYVSGRTKKERLRKLGYFSKVLIISGNQRYYLGVINDSGFVCTSYYQF